MEMRRSSTRGPKARQRIFQLLAAAAGAATGLLLAILSLAPIAPLYRLVPVASASAYLVKSASTVDPTSTSLNGLSVFQAIFTWLAVLSMTFWVGGLIWETAILSPRASSSDPDLDAAAAGAGRRFQHLAPYALGLLLVADVGLVSAEGSLMANGWIGALSPPVLGRVIFGSRFGLLWCIRQLVVLLALVVTLLARRQGEVVTRIFPSRSLAIKASFANEASAAISDWRYELMQVLGSVPHLPYRLIAGVRRQNRFERILCLLGIALLVVFTLSGQTPSLAPNSAYAATIDLLFLFCEAAWLGGLFYLGYVLLPASSLMKPRQRARILALGLPQFGALAIVCAFLLIVTGLLNMTIQFISWPQFLTTIYGRILAVMIELFLIIVAMGAYHAFSLRPRLVKELSAPGKSATGEQTLVKHDESKTLVGATRSGAENVEWQGNMTRDRVDGTPGAAPPLLYGGAAPGSDQEISPRAYDLEERLRDWLRREALLGGAVLLCLVLLGIFAISLLPTLATGSSSGSKGPFIGTQIVSNYTVTMQVSPDIFGTNTFTVTVKDAKGLPVADAGVLIEMSSLDMDMGTQSLQLKHTGSSAPGSYSSQSEITMAGHWQVAVKIQLPQNGKLLAVDFQFVANY